MSLTQVLRRNLRHEVSQINGLQTSKQLADLEEKRTSLRNRIQQWRQTQLIYTPCVASLVGQSLSARPDDHESLSPELAESIPLHLPSSLPKRSQESLELATVLEKERRLRIAQADDALAEIRRQRRIITGLWQFKKFNVDGTGNRTCTRMRALYNSFNLRARRYAECYRAARNALLSLDPDGDWQSRLRDLRENDIRGPGKDETGPGNGRFEPSWIWLVPRVPSAPGIGDSDQVLNDSLRVEWAKAQARKHRWEEEVLLIQEEMRRVVKFHEWKAGWWRTQVARRFNVDARVLHGVAAYAEKQAYLCECLARSCVRSWLPILKGTGAAHDWEVNYSLLDVADVCCAPTVDDDDSGVDFESDEEHYGGKQGGFSDQDTYMDIWD